MVLAWMASTAPGALEQSARPPATVLLIRHAEKPEDGGIGLSRAGFERARVLPRLFGGAGAAPPDNLPRPDALFATRRSRQSNRPVETITPLSQFLMLPINGDFADDEYEQLAKLLLSGQYAGKVILVAWHHGTLPALAEALGGAPRYGPWPEGQFDRVWRIDYRAGRPLLMDLPQALLSGDSR
jgi:hypothetical protein